MDIEKIRQAVHKKVCVHCIDLDENGKCTLTGERQCGVERHLEKIIDVVRSVDSKNIDDYVQKLREIVCHDCKNQNSDGRCQLRNDADCGLDRYFALVIEAIEETEKKTK